MTKTTIENRPGHQLRRVAVLGAAARERGHEDAIRQLESTGLERGKKFH
ncbi:MAG TPA: hypothetical protein PLB55_19555 [Prosthecobacter sp.]|nr:hypothetical protein [Prosthecobacter sp.]